MNKITYILFSLVIVVSSCRKDISEEQTAIFIATSEEVNTNLHGRVIDIAGRSLPEVQVDVADRTVFTNSDGYFHLPNISVPREGFAIEVTSLNSGRVIKRVVPQANSNTTEEIVLLPTRNTTMHDGSTFSVVSDTINQVTVSIQSNSLVDLNNQAYEGQFSALVQYYDPTKTTTLRAMPGNLQGINFDSERVGLGSYGMIDIQITGENGQSLQLAEDQVASVRMTAASFPEPPASVATWRLDNNSGIWLEEGAAELVTLEGQGFYVFDVSDFDFWNCDVPVENTRLSGTVVDTEGIPLESRLIQFSFVEDGTTFFTSGGYTNNRGEFEARVPIEKDLLLGIYDANCRGFIYQQEIAALQEPEEKIQVTADIEDDYYVISGFAQDCTSDAFYDNATVFLYDVDDKVIASTQTNADGRFTLHNTCFADNIEEGFTLGILDLESFVTVTSETLPFTEIDVEIGNVLDCDDDNFFVTVESGFGLVSFSEPEASYDVDSLVIITQTDESTFTLIGQVGPDGNSQLSLVQVGISPDITLTCTSQFGHTDCNESVTFTITENNANTRIIAGRIQGLLYYGQIEEPDSTLSSDVTIEFRVMYN